MAAYNENRKNERTNEERSDITNLISASTSWLLLSILIFAQGNYGGADWAVLLFHGRQKASLISLTRLDTPQLEPVQTWRQPSHYLVLSHSLFLESSWTWPTLDLRCFCLLDADFMDAVLGVVDGEGSERLQNAGQKLIGAL